MAKNEVIGVKTTQKNEEINSVEKYEIFNLVKQGNSIKIAIGNYLISNIQFESIEEAKMYIDRKPWELIVNTTCCIYDISKKVEQQNN